MKDNYLSAAVIILVPVIGTCLLVANLARAVPFPMSMGFPNLPQMQMSAQNIAIDTATPEAPPVLKVVA